MVDDEPLLLESLRRTLKRGNYELTSTSDPQVAISLLETAEFDLLLSDIDMPGCDGHELMAHARKLQPSTVRVFLTGSGNLDAAVRAINEGEVHRFVRKPYDASALRKTIAEAVARKEDLRRMSEASARAGERQQLYAQLEAEHPGITSFEIDSEGRYEIATESQAGVAKAMGLESLL